MNAEESARKIRLICLDVDGVMTDGRVILSSDGTETRFFDIQDGHGIKLALRAGYHVALISGRESPITAQRARELGIEMVYQNVKIKIPVFEEILDSLQLGPDEALYMGDDLPDLPVMRRAGLAIAPANAVEEVKQEADLITTHSGGRGAVREALEWLLKTAGRWDEVFARYVTQA